MLVCLLLVLPGVWTGGVAVVGHSDALLLIDVVLGSAVGGVVGLHARLDVAAGSVCGPVAYPRRVQG